MKINGIIKVLPEYLILVVVLVRRRRGRRRRGCLTWVCAEAVSSGDAARVQPPPSDWHWLPSWRRACAHLWRRRAAAWSATGHRSLQLPKLVVASFYELSNHFQNQDKINSHRISIVAVVRSFNFGGGISSLSTIEVVSKWWIQI